MGKVIDAGTITLRGCNETRFKHVRWTSTSVERGDGLPVEVVLLQPLNRFASPMHEIHLVKSVMLASIRWCVEEPDRAAATALRHCSRRLALVAALCVAVLTGWRIRGFSLRENAHVRGANGHLPRKPSSEVLHRVTRGRLALVAAMFLAVLAGCGGAISLGNCISPAGAPKE